MKTLLYYCGMIIAIAIIIYLVHNNIKYAPLSDIWIAIP